MSSGAHIPEVPGASRYSRADTSLQQGHITWRDTCIRPSVSVWAKVAGPLFWNHFQNRDPPGARSLSGICPTLRSAEEVLPKFLLLLNTPCVFPLVFVSACCLGIHLGQPSPKFRRTPNSNRTKSHGSLNTSIHPQILWLSPRHKKMTFWLQVRAVTLNMSQPGSVSRAPHISLENAL